MKINWNHWEDYDEDFLDDETSGIKKFSNDKERVNKKNMDVARRKARKAKRESQEQED